MVVLFSVEVATVGGTTPLVIGLVKEIVERVVNKEKEVLIVTRGFDPGGSKDLCSTLPISFWEDRSGICVNSPCVCKCC